MTAVQRGQPMRGQPENAHGRTLSCKGMPGKMGVIGPMSMDAPGKAPTIKKVATGVKKMRGKKY